MKFCKPILITLCIVAFEYVIFITFLNVYEGKMNELEGQTDYYHYLFSGVNFSSIIAYLIALILFFRRGLISSITEIKRAKFSGSLVLYSFVGGIGVYLLSLPLYEVDLWLKTPEANVLDHDITSPEFFAAVWINLLIMPLLKEGIYRKFFLSALTKYYSNSTAILISTICFVFYYYVTHDFILCVVPLSIITSLIYLRTNSILYPVIIHFIYLFLVEITDTFAVDPIGAFPSYTIAILVLSLIGTGLIWPFFKHQRKN
jgi:membrane protease YdiL (CAAX protease family)